MFHSLCCQPQSSFVTHCKHRSTAELFFRKIVLRLTYVTFHSARRVKMIFGEICTCGDDPYPQSATLVQINSAFNQH